MSMGALADERKDTRTEAECDQGPDIWDEEKQECILVGAPFAFEVFPKPMKEQEESKSFLQSVILFLPEQEGDSRNKKEKKTTPSIEEQLIVDLNEVAALKIKLISDLFQD